MTRTIVITGADSGIGKTTASLAETHGWQVIRADLRGGDVQVDLATQQGRSAFVTGVTALVGDRLEPSAFPPLLRLCSLTPNWSKPVYLEMKQQR